MHSQVHDVLNRYSGRPCFFEPLAGNNGDTLIRMGSTLAISKAQIKISPSIEDWPIIVNGSGDFSYIPDDEPIGHTKQASLLTENSDADYVILPSSFTERNAGRFLELCRGRSAITTIFARDRKSFENLAAGPVPENVQIFLDHDMAFMLHGSEWLQSLRKKTSSSYFLVVERFDRERASSVPKSYSFMQFMARIFPSSLSPVAKRILLPLIRRKSAFLKAVERKFITHFPEVETLPLHAADISLPQNHDFDDFCREIAGAAGVASTRLHVCILAAMLGKPTLAIQGAEGTKISECFKQSLSSFPNAKLWDIGQQ